MGYEWGGTAFVSIFDFKKFIHVEDQFIKKEHELGTAIFSWSNIIGHLDERIPDNMQHLHKLNAKITDKIEKIQDLIKRIDAREIYIKREETEILKKLNKNIKHRSWRIIKKTEKGVIRLHIKEIKQLHSKFKKLADLMKKSRLIEAINQDMSSEGPTKNYENLEEYYFLQIYKFARAYENVFRELVIKEESLIK